MTDERIEALIEVAHKVPERWAWGSGPTYRCRVCKDCGAVGEYDSWDSPLPHKMRCTYAQARAAITAMRKDAAMDRLVAEGQRCDAMTPQEAAKVKPYETRIGEAGDAYIRSVAFNGTGYHLPAMFRWADLWDAMNKAAQEDSMPLSIDDSVNDAEADRMFGAISEDSHE